MPLLWCAVSGHGFGHAAQVIPVLNELTRRIPNLRAILRTTVPAAFFANRLDCSYSLSPVEQDIGCVQRGPLTIDYRETWVRHADFFADYADRLAAETRAIEAARPDLVLSDISWLGIEAACLTGLPAVGMSNLSWDLILEPHQASAVPGHEAILDRIRAGYRKASCMIRLAPGLAMSAFSNVLDVGPIVQTIPRCPSDLRALLGAAPTDHLVIVGFGGVPLTGLPFDRMEKMSGFRFLVPGPIPDGLHRVHSLDRMPMMFLQAAAAADLIMTKPGYSTIIEAVARRIPVLYVRRYNFADEEPLVAYLHTYGRGAELSASDFHAGNWDTGLHCLAGQSDREGPGPPDPGAAAAADVLASYLE